MDANVFEDIFDEQSRYKKTVKKDYKKLGRKPKKSGGNGGNSVPDHPASTHLTLTDIKPKTVNQKLAFDAYRKGYNLFLEGCPGTGKSFIALAMALKELEKNSQLERVIIVRSTVSSRDMGFLPGNVKEKSKAFENPYVSICEEIYGKSNAYESLTKKTQIEFCTTSFLRGTTFRNCVVILDEAQNASYMELKTVMTRIGDNCRLIVCGDSLQDDLTNERYKEVSGFEKLKRVLDKINSVKRIEFTVDDIVRSGFVRDFIIAENNL